MNQQITPPPDPVVEGCRAVEEAVHMTARLMQDFREQAEGAICQAAESLKQARVAQDQAWQEALQTANEWIARPAACGADSGPPPDGSDHRAKPMAPAPAEAGTSASAAPPVGVLPAAPSTPEMEHPVSREARNTVNHQGRPVVTATVPGV